MHLKSILALLIKTVSCSIGDERPSFISCVRNCANLPCSLDWILRLTHWTCSADCNYKCMRMDVLEDRLNSVRIVQYFGKWPFLRILGAQEIFSVLFSLGNLAACIYGYHVILKGGRSHWMDGVHKVSFLITCNCWLQSAIFHYRDTWLTEKLDYFSACLMILSTVPAAIIRSFGIKKRQEQLKIAVAMMIVYFQHVLYMLFVQFDYGYNIRFNGFFGFVSNILWVRFAVFHRDGAVKRNFLRFVALNVVSMLMVTVDFPPFFDLLDMHALWHLSTIPVTLFWYRIIADDCDDDERVNRINKTK